MSIVRFSPLSDVINLQREMNKLFETFSPGTRRADNEGFESAVWRPVVDVHEDENSYLIDLELPGLKREDLKINFQDNSLTIAGERRYGHESGGSESQNTPASGGESGSGEQKSGSEGNGNGAGNGAPKVEVQSEKKMVNAHRLERSYGRFYRSFSFPTMVDAERITARFEDGILAVTVPKAEAVKPRQISIG